METCREDGELLEDGTCKIFLNTKGKIETGIGQELVRFLKWIGEPDAGKKKEENDLLITKLRTQITEFKEKSGNGGKLYVDLVKCWMKKGGKAERRTAAGENGYTFKTAAGA